MKGIGRQGLCRRRAHAEVQQAKGGLTDKSIICALLPLHMGAGDLNLLDC